MFAKILIANRGEIACRIIKTAQRLGVKTVAVFSDADTNSQHVELADEAIWIGASPSSESYLRSDAIIAAAKQTGAEAIHPGFGFLSENASFVEAVEAAGLIFIGPGSEAIKAMGDKITSKRIAEKAGVSVVPGGADAVADLDEAAKLAADIGYPVMIKASAGGGGKGMRLAHDELELRSNMPQAQNEALSSFGDERVFIEKFITQPRHIEIQILADSHGNIVYLGERECSMQRRHQKVFEEAPSPFISDATRKAMGEEAVRLASAVNYCSAGTVEFIAGADESFYFLEMNTRLQVEHPVTEMVYDIDLVEWMLKIAAGGHLDFKQSDIKPRGWAMEARVYAEDPSKGFLPSIGQLVRYQEPSGVGVRTDSGVAEGDTISMFYDPMIAKLIAHGATRDEAINRLADALDAYVIEGVGHNRQFLRHVCDHTDFRAGHITTGFIAEHYPNGYAPMPATGERQCLMRALAALLVADRWHRFGANDKSFMLYHDDQEVEVLVDLDPDIKVTIDGQIYAFDVMPVMTSRLFMGFINGKQQQIQWHRSGERVKLMMAGEYLNVLVLPARASHAQSFMPIKETTQGRGQIVSPMPGLLSKVLVAEGDIVTIGDDVAVLEAMKMENVLKAEENGVVDKIHCSEGDSLRVDDLIMTLKSG